MDAAFRVDSNRRDVTTAAKFRTIIRIMFRIVAVAFPDPQVRSR